MRSRRWPLIVATAAVTGALIATAAPAPSQADDGVATDRTILVTFDAAQADAAARAEQAVTAAGGTVTTTEALSPQIAAVTVSDLTDRQTSQVESRATAAREVRAAQTVGRVYPTATDDTYYRALWNISNGAGSAYGVDAEDAWPLSTGKGAVIGVVDSGITSHPDLNAHVIAGYDFFSGDTNPTDDGPVSATDWHGTHVAGIAAALPNNRTGVIGVAPNASIEPIRVIGSVRGEGSASDEDLASAILWGAGVSQAHAKVKNSHPADVLNLSLGSDSNESLACPVAIQAAIDAAVQRGTAVVVATGNGDRSGNGVALDGTYPANCNNVIRVTATGNDGLRAAYSNFGSTAFPATVAAPGGSAQFSDDRDSAHWVLSTWNNASKKATTGAASYIGMVGTSMAAPHVAGVIALLRSVRPGISVAEITQLLTSNVKALPDGCASHVCGAGIVNAAATVAAALGRPVPSAHPSISALTITGSIRLGSTVTATPTASPAGAPIAYQWLRSGKAIAGATKPTYTPTTKDKGKKLSVSATITYGLSKAHRTSAAQPVLAGVFTSTSAPVVSGTPSVGKTLRVRRGSWSPTPSGYRYQWLRNSTPIKGATGTTYRLKAADRGVGISARVSVRRGSYVTTSASSAVVLIA